MEELPEDINSLARKLGEQRAESARQKAEARKQAMEAKAKQEAHKQDIEALCQKFHQWATANKVRRTSFWGGWMLCSYVTESGESDYYIAHTSTTSLWVTPSGEVKIHANGYSVRVDWKHLAVFSVSDIRKGIAVFVLSSEKQWEE